MVDAPTAAALQNILRREGRSLLQYAAEAFPWTRFDDRATLEKIHQLIDEERRAATTLSAHMREQRIELPYLGAYPANFTNINYVSLAHLLPMLVEHETRNIGGLERDLADVTDPETRELVRQMLDIKRRHLATLEGLATLENSAKN